MNIYKRKYYTESDKSLSEKSEMPKGLSSYKFSTKKSKNKSKSLKSQRQNSILNKAGSATPSLVHRVLTKMGYGPTSELIDHIQSLPGTTDSDKILSYIDEQLSPDSIDDSAAQQLLNNGYQTLNKSRTQLYQQHYRRPDEQEIPWDYHILPGRETFYASFMLAINSKRQLFEIMTDFWHNHFNVYMDGDGVPAMFVQYDRDVIRNNALGNFRQMLEDVTGSVCMLDYLGNGVNNKDAPNENFARELLELHTVGAESYLGHMAVANVPVDSEGRKIGYVEADVLEMARALTGWSYSGADWWDYQDGNVATGEFLFRDDWHDQGDKQIMGNTYSYDNNNQLKDMQDILDSLAEHPATAKFLATKLCKRFISDTPSVSIIDAVQQTIHLNWQAPDQIKLAMETLLKSSEFLNTWAEKIKRPFERAASAMRQMGFTYDFDPTKEHSSWMFWEFRNTGQNLFYWTSPNGYPDTKAAWLGASSIMSTWRFMQWMARFRDDNDNTYNDVLNITQLHFSNPSDRTANNLVNYWFEKACGVQPENHTQDKLAQFMSYDDTSDPQGTERNTPIDLSTNGWPDYNQDRLFAMVSTIFLTSEFNYR